MLSSWPSLIREHRPSFRHGRVKNVVDIDWQQLKEPLFSGGRNSVGSVIVVGPSVRPVREASVSKMIDNAFVWIFLRPHEYQTATIDERCNQNRVDRNALF